MTQESRTDVIPLKYFLEKPQKVRWIRMIRIKAKVIFERHFETFRDFFGNFLNILMTTDMSK